MAGERILIVEDERAVARGLEYGLEREGFEVLWADTGQRALDLARTHDPQLILLDIRLPDISGFDLVQVETRAGDLLIWNSMLAHGIRPNRSDRPRIAQYISMSPAQEEKAELRQWRIRSWQDRIPPEGYAFPGDPRGWEQQQPGPAQLTALGQKLLGLANW